MTCKRESETCAELSLGSWLQAPRADLYPVWATGVCWWAVEGQQGTLLLRPLRSHLGNSWAEGRDVPGLAGFGKQTHLRWKAPPRMHHVDVSTRARVHAWGLCREGDIGEATNQQSEAFEERTPARQRLPTEAGCLIVFQREARCRAAVPDHVWALSALVGSTMSHPPQDAAAKQWPQRRVNAPLSTSHLD